jgi:hypothetical protein
VKLYVRARMAGIRGNLDFDFSLAAKVFCDAIPRFGFFVFHFALTSAALLTQHELAATYILTRTALAMGTAQPISKCSAFPCYIWLQGVETHDLPEFFLHTLSAAGR